MACGTAWVAGRGGWEDEAEASPMRTHVTFRHPTEFVPLSDEDGVLAVRGAAWFAAMLRRVPGLEIDGDPCQELCKYKFSKCA